MKNLLSILVTVFVCGKCLGGTTIVGGPTISGSGSGGLTSNEVYQIVASYGGGSGGGAAVSNATKLNLNGDTLYTNNTAYFAEVSVPILLNNTVAGLAATVTLYVDTNQNGTMDYSYQVASVNNTAPNVVSLGTVMKGWIPPYASFALTNGPNGSYGYMGSFSSIAYFSTNSGGGSGDVTQAGLALGSYVINGQAITNSMSMLAQLENGSAKTSRSPGSYNVGVINNSSNSIIAGAGTSGILKSLFCHLDVGSTGYLQTNINNLELFIYTDGTATGNLTARVKVADLLNCYYRWPATNWTIRNNTRFLNYYADSSPLLTGLPVYHFTLNLPMAFTNGISCKITNTVYGGQWTHGYFQTQYELKSLPPELASARTYITNLHGSFSGTTSNFLFGTSGATEIVGFQIGVSNHNLTDIEAIMVDKGLAFYNDSTLLTYDLDDWLENTYGGVFDRFLSYDVGWPNNDNRGEGNTGAMEAYKWLWRDSIRSTNSMVVYSDANITLNTAYYTFFYIKR